MGRFDPSPLIEGSQKITSIFGHWPSFHDAEILEVCLRVSDAQPWVPGSESPVIEMKAHVFEMTKDVTPEGYFVLTKHTLTHIRFCRADSIEFSDFRFQNRIFDLEFAKETESYPRGHPDGRCIDLLRVRIHSSVGLSGNFRCQSAEVVSAEPCDENGNLLISSC